MKKLVLLILVAAFAGGCASNARFIKTDESFHPQEKSGDVKIVFKKGEIQHPHKVVGVIEAVLGKHARKTELDHLIVKKAKEIGADGVMLVEYDVDKNVYLKRHHHVVGRGPYRHHVVSTHPKVAVKKRASAIAVVFK